MKYLKKLLHGAIRQPLLVGLLASLLFHGLVLFSHKSLRTPLPSFVDRPPAPRIHFRVIDRVSAAPTSNPVASAGDKSPTADKKLKPRPKKKPARTRQHAIEPSGIAHAPGPPPGPARLAYKDLFPQLAPGDPALGSDDPAPHSPPKFRSFDDDYAAISLAQEATNAPSLIRFTRELTERLSIPVVVRKAYSSATAYLKLDETRSRWVIVRLTGEPIFRALIYEALGGEVIDSYLASILKHCDYRAVKLDFSLAQGHRTERGDHWSYAFNKNIIALNYYEFDDENTRSKQGEFIDVLGALKMVGQAATSRDDRLRADPRVRTLMLSPAYLREIKH